MMRMYGNLRSQAGFSLVTVLIIGLTATMLVSAMFAAVLPSLTRTSNMRTQTGLRNAAEAGLDWAVSQYNAAGLSGSESFPGIDNASYGTTGFWQDVSSSVTNPSGNNSFVPRTQVQVSNIQPDNSSYVYNWRTAYFPGGSQFLPVSAPVSYVAPSGTNQTSNGVTTNKWRVITVRAIPPTTNLSDITDVNGNLIQGQQAFAVVKQLQVVLKPNIPSDACIKGPLTANNIVMNGSNYEINSYDSGVSTTPAASNYFLTGADVHSNGPVDLGGAKISGGVYVYPPVGLTPTDLVMQNTAHINGDVELNNGKGSNVDSTHVDGNISEHVNHNPWQMPNVPNHPTGSSRLPVINNTSMTIGPGQFVGSGGSGPGGSQPSSANPARYYIQSNTQEISLTSRTVTVTGPTRLYLEGNTSNQPNNTTQIVKITGTGNIITQSKKPSDFVLYYAGSGTLDLTGLGTFYGVVIAPNATIKLAGNASIYGAVVGNMVGLNGGGSQGAIHYDKQLSTIPLLLSTQRYEAISWREF
jgi:hypothetical protein